MVLQQHAVAVAYFDLTRQVDWDAIVQAGRKVRLVVPDGSFRTLPDPVAETQQFQACQRAGQLVLGYVYTRDGDADVTTVNGEVDDWVTKYGTAIDGFYFDSSIYLPGGKTDQQYQDYYRPLIADVRSRHPGRRIGLAASQYKYPWVIDVADFATIWEKPASDYISNYVAAGEQGSEPPPSWWSEHPDQVIVTVTGTSRFQVADVQAASRARNAGNLYIHDDANSYGHLSQWWSAELTGLAGWNPLTFSLVLGDAQGPSHGTVTMDLDLGESLPFVAWGAITWIDPRARVTGADFLSAEIAAVDGVPTGVVNDLAGLEPPADPVRRAAVTGTGRVITLRLRSIPFGGGGQLVGGAEFVVNASPSLT